MRVCGIKQTDSESVHEMLNQGILNQWIRELLVWLLLVTKFKFHLKWKVATVRCVYFCRAQTQTEIPNDVSSVFVYVCTWVCACYIHLYTFIYETACKH